MQWRVDSEGNFQWIYKENFDFTWLREVQIRRESQVEPDPLPPEEKAPTWCVDRPTSGGPVLTGFNIGFEAIQKEIR